MTAKGECVFCKIASKKIPSRIAFESEDILAFEDNNPQGPVHLLIIPKSHIGSVSDLVENDAQLAGELILTAKMLAKRLGIDESGYRIVFNCGRDAGQDVPHLHLHLLGGRLMTWPPG